MDCIKNKDYGNGSMNRDLKCEQTNEGIMNKNL